jgi:photosystem II stability/assembly factor-like uncharacterized protein
VLRTTDGGQTWSTHRKGALRDCHSITFHLANGDRVYEAGGTGAGAAYSANGGETWTQPKDDALDRHYGWAVAADPANPAVWYVSESTGPFAAHGGSNAQAYIYRHDGSRWKRLGGGLPDPLSSMPYALITDPAAPGHLYAGLQNGEVWHSADHGDTWMLLPVRFSSIHRSLIRLS